jgi:hypothetical protein
VGGVPITGHRPAERASHHRITIARHACFHSVNSALSDDSKESKETKQVEGPFDRCSKDSKVEGAVPSPFESFDVEVTATSPVFASFASFE